jgi:hypothetical protein
LTYWKSPPSICDRKGTPSQIAEHALAHLRHQVASVGKAQRQRRDRSERNDLLVVAVGIRTSAVGAQSCSLCADQPEEHAQGVYARLHLDVLPCISSRYGVGWDRQRNAVPARGQAIERKRAGVVRMSSKAQSAREREGNVHIWQDGFAVLQLTVGVGVDEGETMDAAPRRGRRPGRSWQCWNRERRGGLRGRWCW